jgi:hypothetical protein
MRYGPVARGTTGVSVDDVQVGELVPVRIPNCTIDDRNRPDAPGLVHDWKYIGVAPNHADTYECPRCDATSTD